MCGSLLGLLAVALGAFGAHGLKAHFKTYPDLKPVYETAVQYHMYHALALLAVAWIAHKAPGTWTHLSGGFFIAGVFIFSGSLYTLSVTNIRWLGAITPIGGVALMAGWLFLAISAWKGLR